MLCTVLLCINGWSQSRTVKLSIVETTDVHGNYLPYNFINDVPGKGSMARIYSYVKQLRQSQGYQNVVLLDNGDILQGQPSAYYYNYIDTESRHLCADVMNFMGYDAATIGNHDVETGHKVYDRWTAQCAFPMLGANVTATATGKPYFKPYTIIEKNGVRVAVLGLITPGIPMWLPETLWSGLRFDDLVSTAKRYMPEMKKQADVIVCLMHSGVGDANKYETRAENGAIALARQVPGFDVVFCGHDHRRACRREKTNVGDSVWVLNPAANAHAVAQADLTLCFDGKTLISKKVSGSLVNIDQLTPDEAFTHQFAAQTDSVKQFTQQVIGYCEDTMTTTPAFFGPSAFVDFIHQMQLSITGADVSFVAPLSMTATINEGPIKVSDMFKLYSYENLLYVMELTGKEIKNYLEYSYAHWTNQMKSADDHLLLFRKQPEAISDAWQRLQYPSYNFDSAAGLLYTVDVTKPAGEKVTITGMADGRPFSMDHTYRCAVNSYRGNGGGGLLTEGAGIAKGELSKRVVWSTEKDLRYYLMVGISELGNIRPAPLGQWHFEPAAWAAKARIKDEPLVK